MARRSVEWEEEVALLRRQLEAAGLENFKLRNLQQNWGLSTQGWERRIAELEGVNARLLRAFEDTRQRIWKEIGVILVEHGVLPYGAPQDFPEAKERESMKGRGRKVRRKR